MIRIKDKDLKYGLDMKANRWAAVDEIMGPLSKIEIGKKNSDPRGAGMPIMGNGKEMFTDASDSHSIIFGSTGSKKTRLVAMPTIMCLADSGKPESMVISDPKGELYERTAYYLEKKGYDVMCINLRDISSGYGNTWNPLTNMYRSYKKDKAKGVEMIADFTSMIIDQPGGNKQKGSGNNFDKFWDQTATMLLTALTMILFDNATDEKEINIKSLVKLCTEYGRECSIDDNGIYKIAKLLDRKSLLYIQLSGLFAMADKTRQSVQATLFAALSIFMNNEILTNNLSQASEIDVAKMRREKCAVFMILPDEKETYNSLASMFVQEMYAKMIEEAQSMQKGSNSKEKLVRCNFILDEFANLPKIKDINAKVSASRSREIRFFFFVQGLAQLRMKYGDETHNIIGNCNNLVFLNSKEYELLDFISRLCGEVIYDNGYRYSKPLISTTELQNLSKEKGEVIMLLGRNRSFMTELPDIDMYNYPRTGRLLMKYNSNCGEIKVLDSASIVNIMLAKELGKIADTSCIGK